MKDFTKLAKDYLENLNNLLEKDEDIEINFIGYGRNEMYNNQR
jgi:hypothetical protein